MSSPESRCPTCLADPCECLRGLEERYVRGHDAQPAAPATPMKDAAYWLNYIRLYLCDPRKAVAGKILSDAQVAAKAIDELAALRTENERLRPLLSEAIELLSLVSLFAGGELERVRLWREQAEAALANP